MHFNRKSIASLGGAAVLMLLAAGAQANDLYVAATGSDNNPGTSDQPFKTIQKGITTATANDTIHVAAGTYREALTWSNKDLILQGAGAGQSIIDPSTANGGPGGPCLTTYELTSASRIIGFTLTGGAAGKGGGMYNSYGRLTITDCIFSNNEATSYGGGIYNVYSSPTITNCMFTGNTAALDGGGMGNFGGNVSSLTITNCTFTRNSAGSAGGGVFNSQSPTTVTNCLFTGNTAGAGGGMVNSSSTLYLSKITNCTFTGNVATSVGGGMFNYANSPAVTNCILVGNVGGGMVNDSASPTVTYSDVQDLSNTVPDANGNFAADPLFVDAANGDVHLQPGSPCRNVGNNAVITSPPFLTVGSVIIDLDGNARIANGTVDLGAYEVQNRAPIANDDAYSANQDTTLTVPAAGVLANDTDADGDPLTAVLVSGPAHGSLTLNADGSFTYSPAAGYFGSDSFTYKANDGAADSNVATVSITVVRTAKDYSAQIAAIQTLKGQVSALVTAHKILPADGQSLQAKLDAAIAALQANDPVTAKTKLMDFINQVSSFIKTGKLTRAQGQPLIDSANAIIAMF